MKRYFRSKKRSQKRDHANADSEVHTNNSEETESVTNPKIVKEGDVVRSVKKNRSTKKSVEVNGEVGKRTNKMESVDDSSQTKAKTAHTSMKRNVEKINVPETMDYIQNELKNESDISSETEKSEKERKTATTIETGLCMKKHEEKTKHNVEQSSGRNDCVNISSTNILENKTNKACNHNDSSRVVDTTENNQADRVKAHAKYAQEEKVDSANKNESSEHLLLEGANVWFEKYKYNDAEKQYHQQMNYKTLDNLEKKALKAEPPKIKVVYEIIEEIVETTEITYHIVRKDPKHQEKNIKVFEPVSLNLNKSLSDIGSYVNRLETRVKTLEEGEKKIGGGRSSSLSSSESDEGVDLTGKNSVTLSDSDSQLSDWNTDIITHTDKNRKKGTLVY